MRPVRWCCAAANNRSDAVARAGRDAATGLGGDETAPIWDENSDKIDCLPGDYAIPCYLKNSILEMLTSLEQN